MRQVSIIWKLWNSFESECFNSVSDILGRVVNFRTCMIRVKLIYSVICIKDEHNMGSVNWTCSKVWNASAELGRQRFNAIGPEGASAIAESLGDNTTLLRRRLHGWRPGVQKTLSPETLNNPHNFPEFELRSTSMRTSMCFNSWRLWNFIKID